MALNRTRSGALVPSPGAATAASFTTQRIRSSRNLSLSPVSPSVGRSSRIRQQAAVTRQEWKSMSPVQTQTQWSWAQAPRKEPSKSRSPTGVATARFAWSGDQEVLLGVRALLPNEPVASLHGDDTLRRTAPGLLPRMVRSNSRLPPLTGSCPSDDSGRMPNGTYNEGREENAELKRILESVAASQGQHVPLTIRVIIPPEHNGFEVGGRENNQIVKVNGSQDAQCFLDTNDSAVDVPISLQAGWKTIAVRNRPDTGKNIRAAVIAAKRKNQICLVTFLVPPSTSQHLGKRVLRQSAARNLLNEALQNRSLEELEQLTADGKHQLLSDPTVQNLMVQAGAVMELGVLLGTKSAKNLQLSMDLRSYARRGDVEALAKALSSASAEDVEQALLERDSGGNVVLHYSADIACAQLIHASAPHAQAIKNMDGQRPIFTYLSRRPRDAQALESRIFFREEGELLDPDESGVSAAMLTQGEARRKFETFVSSWAEFVTALSIITPGGGAVELSGIKRSVSPKNLSVQSAESGTLMRSLSPRNLLSPNWKNKSGDLSAQPTELKRSPSSSNSLILKSTGDKVSSQHLNKSIGAGSNSAQLLTALNALRPPGSWSGLLCFHCFGDPEVWRDARHNEESRRRSWIVWRTLRSRLQALSVRDESCEMTRDVTKQLLAASKGPRHSDFDSRESYREELAKEIWLLEMRSGDVLGTLFDQLSEECDLSLASSRPPSHSALPPSQGHGLPGFYSNASSWLLQVPSELLAISHSPVLHEVGLKPRLILEPRGPHEPRWVLDRDLRQMSVDLANVGEIGATEKNHAEYELFCIAGTELDQVVLEEDLVWARWHAAWLRGLCQRMQEEMYDAIKLALGPLAAKPDAFVYRSSAKGFPRICEKMLEAIQEVADELQKNQGGNASGSTANDQLVRRVIRKIGSLICDISGCSFIAETPEELREAYRNLVSCETLNVLRKKNGFMRNISIPGSYRDLKVWVECQNDGMPLIVEVQLHLREFYKQKQWTHLPYVVRRGSYDWPHLRDKMEKWMVVVSNKDAEERLKHAMLHSDVTALRDAIRYAKAIAVDPAVLLEAETFLASLEAKNKLQRLRCNTPGSKDPKALREAVQMAQALNPLERSESMELEIKRAEAELTQLEVREKLRLAIQNEDAQGLERAISNALQVRLPAGELEQPRCILSRLLAWAQVEVAKRDLDAAKLEAAIGKCREAGVPKTKLDEAEHLLKVIAATTNLQQAMKSEIPKQMRQAIRSAREAGVEEKHILEVEHLLSALNCAQALQDSIAQKDKRMLRDAIEQAQKLGIDDRRLEEARRVFAQLEAQTQLRKRLREAETLLSEVRNDGFVQAINEKLTDTWKALQDACARAQSVGLGDVVPLLENARKLLAELDAREQLQRSASAEDVKGLASAISAAKGAGVEVPTWRAAQSLHDKLKVVQDLQRALTAKDVDAVRTAIGMATKVAVPEADEVFIEASRFVAQKMAWQKLATAIKEEDPDDLHDAIQQGVKAGVDRNLMLAEAPALMKKMKASNELEEAMKGNDVEALKKAIDQATKEKIGKDKIQAAKTCLLQKEAEAALRKAMGGNDLKALKDAYNKAAGVGVPERVLDEATRAMQKL